jgi:DNA-binding NarL/FixJ family response regulator
MKNQKIKQIKLPNGTVYSRVCNGGAHHQKGRESWSEGEVKTLMRLAMTGLSNKEIAEMMKRSYSSICAKRQSLGITKKAVRELRNIHGNQATPQDLSSIMSKPEVQPRWSNGEVTTLVRLVTAGLSNTEIGRAMGRSVNSVREMRKRSNLPGSRVVNATEVDVRLTSQGEEPSASPWKRLMTALIK